LQPGAGTRSGALDGLRALAALSVLAFHAWLYRPGGPPGPRDALADQILFELCRGLILFFVLSGYLLYRAFVRGPVDWRRFALRRVARIVPAYYVCVLGCLALLAAVGYSAGLPAAHELPLFAVLAQNYTADTVTQLNPVTWTLGVEAAFYVLLPIVGLLALRLRGAAHVALLCGLVLVTLGWNALTDGFVATRTLPAYIGHFALGMLVAVWAERRGEREPLAARATAALVLAGAAIVALNSYWAETAARDAFVRAELGNLPAALGFALILAAAVAGSGPSVAWLRARALVAVGVVSYGVYLWHVPLLLVARELDALPGSWPARLALLLPAALALGALSWRWVERPSIGWAAAYRGRRRERQQPARAPA
jgi:peptidoglycan/LPS O-acetylase OafA/YrhL